MENGLQKLLYAEVWHTVNGLYYFPLICCLLCLDCYNKCNKGLLLRYITMRVLKIKIRYFHMRKVQQQHKHLQLTTRESHHLYFRIRLHSPTSVFKTHILSDTNVLFYFSVFKIKIKYFSTPPISYKPYTFHINK